MDLSIIIVNWNSREYLRKCLTSLFQQTAGVACEVIVIDSASFDGCDAMLRDSFPGVRFLQSDSNLGFAKANNLACKASTGEHLLFLNPDTEVMGPAISLMLEAIRVLPDAGVVGCKLLNSDGTIQTSCIKAFPSLMNQWLDAELLHRAFPKSALWGMAPLFAGHTAPREVDVISGACVLMRRSVFEEIGRFSEDYFMYSEDVDLCFKSRQAGHRNYYVPAATVRHHGGGSTACTGVSKFSSVMLLESRWRFFRKSKPAWYRWLYRAGMAMISAVRVGLAVLLWPFSLFRSDGVNWQAAVVKWGSRLRWTLGLETWVKRY